MKKAIMIFVVAVSVMLILPASGICDNPERSLVNQIENLIATNDQARMASTLEELNSKV